MSRKPLRAVPELTDRHAERRALERLAEAVRAGQSRVLVMRGDPGVGKTVLLDYLAGRASDSGCRVARAVGVQSEMELAFAGLHQLCAPMLDHASGFRCRSTTRCGPPSVSPPGQSPDRFLVGLGVLSLLPEVAEERPLICVIDDEQWLDRASVQALGFVARRLAADRSGWCSRPANRARNWPDCPCWTWTDWRQRCAGAAGVGAGRAPG